MGKKIKTDKSSTQVTLKQERVRAYVCARGVHKRGQEREQGKGTCRHTQECCEGQGTVLTPRVGKSAALAHSGGCGFPPASYIQTKPLQKKGTFLDTGRQRVNLNKE